MALICRDCKFWEDMSVLKNRGMCKRYPQTLDTAASHWCGEFIESERAEPEEPSEAPVKRRGRPPKEKLDVGTVQ